MADDRETPRAGQGALLLAPLRHHLQGAHGHHAAGRCRRDPGRRKAPGTSLRRMFIEGRGLNSSYAVLQDATGRAFERVVALGIGVGSGLPVRNRLQGGGLLRPDGRARHADGCHPGYFRGPVRHAARPRAHPFGGFQRNGRTAASGRSFHTSGFRSSTPSRAVDPCSAATGNRCWP